MISWTVVLRLRMDKENIDPDSDFKPLKRKKVSKCEPSKRFKTATSEEEINVITKGYIPNNTKRSTSWSVKVFNEWRCAREGLKKCPENLFQSPVPEDLNYWLPRFINEVRKSDGDPYPPRSIHQILAGLQRHMLDLNYCSPKFLDRQNKMFKPIHGACDSVYHSLHSSGVGTSVRHTSVITPLEEKKLWDSRIFGICDPKSLQRTVFFYIGKRFCIRGGEEQRRLGPSQFIRSFNPDCFTYVEHGSKNYAARVKDLRYENKQVPCPAVPENGQKCLVFLLDLYLSKLPTFAFEKDILYLRPKRSKPFDSVAAWYDQIPVGKNTLSTMVKDMCSEAAILGKTNHSLRATGATTLFQNNVPEKVIQKLTGHRSLDALRSYEQISSDQHMEVSKIMLSNIKSQDEISGSSSICGVLGNVNGCSIGNLTVNIGRVSPLKDDSH